MNSSTTSGRCKIIHIRRQGEEKDNGSHWEQYHFLV